MTKILNLPANYLQQFISIFLLLLWTTQCFAEEPIHHQIKLIINPSESFLEVEDTVTLPSNAVQSSSRSFLLHQALTPVVSAKAVTKNNKLNSSLETVAAKAAVPVSRYTVSIPDGSNSITIRYSGKIRHNAEKSDEEYARSFSETPGLIIDDGVFLARSTLWYPVFSDKELVTFEIQIEVPDKWGAISQGDLVNDRRTSGKRLLTWQEKNPQDDIYIIASRYVEYRQTTGNAIAMVFLRKKDDSLAQKYLDVTGQYISMYTSLLGQYPYNKFALVENFWETGYGMPSFTLLGPQVIRFPFIIHSSYPHEILHNYWGNGVFVDYDSGNWAEGLTAYLADHLIQEQRGNGSGYRRNVLQKYTDFVNKEKDFPLTQFRSRHSSATEAVGYGKTMMLFHMLRMKLGDKDFIRSLRNFYRQFQFKYAGFEDVKNVFSTTSDTDLSQFFEQWVKKPGAPQLKLENVKSIRKGKAYLLSLTLKQVQKGQAYNLDVPVVVQLEGQDKVFQKSLTLKDDQRAFSFEVPSIPLQVEIDPEFDLFRRLDSREIPAALSQGFGDDRPLMVLPTDDDDKRIQAYRNLAEQWSQSQSGNIEITDDRQLNELPADRSVWLLGKNNRFHTTLVSQLGRQNVKINNGTLLINNLELKIDDHAILLTSRHPENYQKTLLWLSSENTDAIPGLARKLPHYRKYSYLAFKGDAPENILKGQWNVTESPMKVTLTKDNKGQIAKFPARQALAVLPPVFSAKDMMHDIQFLAAPEREGRGLGSKGLDTAADYIKEAFAKAGLKPGSDDGKSYFQTWSADLGKPVGKVTLKNVIGVLPGSNPKLKAESIIISAHYDHLGLGWPDVHKGDKGKVHHGADDNASGVAVMLELARRIATKWEPERSIVFIAFTGEEAGRLGSKYYVANSKRFPADKVFTVLNLDTVGRLGGNPVTVLGAGSARELVHVFRGTGFVTGVDIKPALNDVGTSDQTSFLEVGIPAIQLFATAHPDFHRPGDTVDKIDESGLVKIATVLKEAAEYLSNRLEPLDVTLDSSSKNVKPAMNSKTGRKVRIGTIPDFTYQGQGMKLDGVSPDSPAQKAGLKKGDIITSMNGKTVIDVAAMSAILKETKSGESILITFKRGEEVKQTRAVAEER